MFTNDGMPEDKPDDMPYICMEDDHASRERSTLRRQYKRDTASGKEGVSFQLPLGLVRGAQVCDGKRRECMYGNYSMYYKSKGRRCADTEEFVDVRLNCLVKQDVNFFENKRVLDIGCNEGLITLTVGGILGAREVVGVDIDVALIDEALKTLRTIKYHYWTPTTAKEGPPLPGCSQNNIDRYDVSSVDGHWGGNSGGDVAGSHLGRGTTSNHNEKNPLGVAVGSSTSPANMVIGDDCDEDDDFLMEAASKITKMTVNDVSETSLCQDFSASFPTNATTSKVQSLNKRPCHDESAPSDVKYRRNGRNANVWETIPPTLERWRHIFPAPSHTSSSNFPFNIEFRSENFVRHTVDERRIRKYGDACRYDVILLLSVTKWIHLHYGDKGIKKLFKKCHDLLHPGGRLVLQPQSWDSYRKKRRIREDIKQRIKLIRLKPHMFDDYLTGNQTTNHTAENADNSPQHLATTLSNGDVNNRLTGIPEQLKETNACVATSSSTVCDGGDGTETHNSSSSDVCTGPMFRRLMILTPNASSQRDDDVIGWYECSDDITAANAVLRREDHRERRVVCVYEKLSEPLSTVKNK